MGEINGYEEIIMDFCYRGMPKLVGAVFDVIYQNQTITFSMMAGILVLAGFWWYKSNKASD